eukprot:g14927.t1
MMLEGSRLNHICESYGNFNNMRKASNLFLLFFLTAVRAQREASVHEVQPTERGVIHTVWVHGPAYSTKLTKFPKFDNAASSTDSQCTTKNDRFTGYDSNGKYCEPASSALDLKPHLLLYSGQLGVVIDAGGLSASKGIHNRNLFPKWGRTSSLAIGSSPKVVYDSLSDGYGNFTFEMQCSDGSAKTYVLGSTKPKFVQIGLVRQGHTVTQISITGLTWHDSETGKIMGPCASFVPQVNSSLKCNGINVKCSDSHPNCVGFIQGQKWGKCYTVCSSPLPTLWAEMSIWGDQVGVELFWDSAYNTTVLMSAQQISQGITCSANITGSLNLGVNNADTRRSSTTSANTGDKSLSLLVAIDEDESISLVEENDNSVSIISTTNGAQVGSRSGLRDIFIEIPTTTGKCGYNMNCANFPLMLVDVVLKNENPYKPRTARLSFSRGFQTRIPSITRSFPSAEITGFNAQLWDSTMKQATGIPVQISKNWHVGSDAAFWAGYDGS